MNDYKIVRQHLAMNSNMFKPKDTVPLIPILQNLLSECGIEKVMKENIRLKNPRYLTQIEKINQKKYKLKNILADYSKKSPDISQFRNIMHRTVLLHDQTNQSVQEMMNRDVGSVD